MSLTPYEDLRILASVHNNPQSTWQKISINILHKYNSYIPSEVCEDRYESFLRFIKPIPQPNQHLPYRLKNFEVENIEREPQNFIFAYAQLKKKIGKTLDSKTVTQLQNYQKKIITKMFYSQKCKSKKIKKDPLYKQEKQNKFIDLLYSQIKDRSNSKGTLSQSIIGQKIQQIFFEIVQKVNEVLQNNSQSKIQNPFNIIKLFNPNSLIDQKRQIFQLFFSFKHLQIQSALLIKDKLNYVSTLFGYQHIQPQYHLGHSRTYDQIQDFNLNSQQQQPLKNKSIQDQNQMIELQQAENIQHFDEIYNQIEPINPFTLTNQEPNEVAHPQQDKKFKFSYQSMQITVNNNQVKIIQQEHQHQEEIKQQAKIEQVKYEQYEAEQKDKTVKRYRIVKKRKAVPKLPNYSKIVIVLND